MKDIQELDAQELDAAKQRTRRNIMKMGVILGSAGVAKVTTANAAVSTVCASVGVCRCFLKGTMIRTALGDRKIEDLVAGDLLPTMFGGLQPIQWIGRYPIRKSDLSRAWVKRALPVRVAQSALAPNVPEADLYVTGQHAFLIDGALIPIEDLVNGATIARLDDWEGDELEYFNIKLESHDVILAEGAPVETLVEVTEAAVNFAEYFRMYGDPKVDEPRCAPLITYAGALGALKSRVRSAVSPWIDRREPIDVIRDRLEERGVALAAGEALSV